MTTTPKSIEEQVDNKSSYILQRDNMAGNELIIEIHISKVDYVAAKFTDLDHALLYDVEHGSPSNTPLADQLLALETIVKRIEEASLTSKKESKK